MRKFKTVVSFVLRICFYMPLALLAYLCAGLSQFFDVLSHGLMDMARAARQITMAPFAKEVIDKINAELKIRQTEALKSIRIKLM
jgi:hypothetical protein